METTQKVAALKAVLTSPAPPAISPDRYTQDYAYVIRWSHVRVPAGVKLEEVLRKEFWVHVAGKMQPNQRILVDADDNSFSAQLKVQECRRLKDSLQVEAIVVAEWVRMSPAPEQVTQEPEPVATEDAYIVRWAGPSAKFRISRKSDNVTISDGHASKEIAEGELKSYLTQKAA